MEYFNKVIEILLDVENNEKNNIEKVVDKLLEAIENKKKIYMFGASHAGILTQEMYYRAGGFMLINPIFSEEISLNKIPVTHTSKMERLEGYAKIIASDYDINKGDVLFIHSVSGRNPISIELAESFKEKGAYIIAITNLKYSKSVKSRKINGKLLYQVADIVIDNHGDIGDASIAIKDGIQKIAPSSTVIGASILNEIIVQLAKRLCEKYEDIPFFYSANLDGGDEKNKKLYNKYKEYIVNPI